jgi:tetratricopeptide (TPR) repeat protein
MKKNDNSTFKRLSKIITCVVIMFGFSGYAQLDTIAQQREARKHVRDGNNFYKQKKYTDAAVSYKKGIEQTGSYYKAAHNLGNSLLEQKNYKEAIPQFELAAKSAKEKRDKAAAYHNIGNAQLAQKEFEKAIDAYKNSLRNNPLDDETRYNLALAKQKLQKQKEDEEKNKKDPPSEYAKRMKKKADGMVEKFQFKAAAELMKKALEKDMTVSNYKEFMEKMDAVIEIKK